MGSKADGVIRVAVSRPQLAKVPGQSSIPFAHLDTFGRGPVAAQTKRQLSGGFALRGPAFPNGISDAFTCGCTHAAFRALLLRFVIHFWLLFPFGCLSLERRPPFFLGCGDAPSCRGTQNSFPLSRWFRLGGARLSLAPTAIT
jgi:hypothetical protein